MLDAYIKVTAGSARWFLFMGLMFVGPVVKVIAVCLMLGGLCGVAISGLGVLSTLGGEISAADGEKYYGMLVIALLCGLAGTGLGVSYNIATDRMYFDRLDDGVDDEEVGLGKKLLNWLFVAALFVGFCYAVYFSYQLKGVPMNGLVGPKSILWGFVWFMAAGIVLGVGRWFYRMGGKAWDVVGDQLRGLVGRGKAVIARRQADKKLRVVPKIEGAATPQPQQGAVVVQFHRRA